MPNSLFQIVCRWCGRKYQAHNETRNHCKSLACRNKEIAYNLNLLINYIDMILRYNIVAKIEIRCPGNDTFGKQVKITSEGYLNDPVVTSNVADIKEEKTEKLDELDRLKKYFKHILQKGIKGNFIIQTMADGIVKNVILNESFAMLDKPVVFGNNLLIIQQNFNKGGN